MKNGFKNSFISLLAVMATMPCWSQATTDSEHNNQPEVEWNVTHKADGATRFEFSLENEKYYYEFKLTGIAVDGEIQTFTPPEILKTKNRITKQWTPYLREIWVDGISDNLKIQIDRPPFLSNESQQMRLSYMVDSNNSGGLIVGGYPMNLRFVDLRKEIEPGDSLANYSITVGGSQCSHSRSFAPNENGYADILIDLKEQTFPIYLQTNLKANVGFNGQKISSHVTAISEHSEGVSLVVHQEIRQRNTPLKHQLKVLQQNNLHGWDEQIIKEWPMVAGNCADVNTANDFGRSLDISGNWLVASDSNDCDEVVFSGAVYVFHKNEGKWQFHSKIKAPKVDRQDTFGIEVQIVDETIYVSTFDNTIQIFKLLDGEWQHTQKIDPLNESDGFLSHFTVYKDLMVFGLTEHESTIEFKNKSAGKVLVYRHDGTQWFFEAILKPQIGQGNDGFGEYVAISDRYIAVSSPELMPVKEGQAQGAVHVFNHVFGQWKLNGMVRPPIDHMDYNLKRSGFGYELKLDGNDLYIQDGHFKYQSAMMEDLPEVCEFSDASGGIHHYKKQGSDWQLVKTIKLQDNPGYLGQIMKATDQGVYFLSNELTTGNQTSTYLNHYTKDRINWKHQILNLQ